MTDGDSETIELRFRFDLDSFLEASKRYERRIPALRFTNRVHTAASLVLVVCAAILFATGEWGVAATALAVAGAGLLIGWGRGFRAVSNYRKSPHADEDVAVTLGPDGFHGVATRGEMRFPWAAFTHAYVEEDGVLLLRGPHLFHWLPDRALVRGDPARLRALVRAHVPAP